MLFITLGKLAQNNQVLGLLVFWSWFSTNAYWIDMSSLCRSAVVSREPSVDRQQHPLAATVGGRSSTRREVSGKGLQCGRQVCSSLSYALCLI